MTYTSVLAAALALYFATTLTSMAVMSLGAALLGAVWLFQARTNVERLKEVVGTYWGRRIGIASIALVAACVLSSVAAWVAPLGWGGHSIQVHWFEDLGKLWYFIWPFVIAASLVRLTPLQRNRVLGAWFGTASVLALLGVVQYFTGWPRAQQIPTDPSHFHATLFLGHHLSVASIFIFPFFASLDLVRQRRRYLGIAALCLLTLFLCYARSVWAALPLGVIIWVIGVASPRRALATVLALVLACVALSRVPAVHDRITVMMGTGERVTLWKANLEFLRLRPLTGTGFRRNIDASSYYLSELARGGDVFSGHAHNNFLDLLGGTGVLGAVAWLAWCSLVLAMFWRGRAQPVMWGFFCAWVVFHLNGLTQVNFWEGKVMHSMMLSVAWGLSVWQGIEVGRSGLGKNGS